MIVIFATDSFPSYFLNTHIGLTVIISDLLVIVLFCPRNCFTKAAPKSILHIIVIRPLLVF